MSATNMLRPAVFFDFGRTLCHLESGSWPGYALYPEAVPAIRRVNENDWLVLIISNQKSIAEGRRTLEEAEARMAEIKDELRRSGAVVDASYICPHCDEDECGCRKPKVALYERARDDLGIDISKSWVVGDLWRDVVAGHTLGARTAQVLTSHRAHAVAPSEYAGVEPDLVARDVLEAVTAIFDQER